MFGSGGHAGFDDRSHTSYWFIGLQQAQIITACCAYYTAKCNIETSPYNAYTVKPPVLQWNGEMAGGGKLAKFNFKYCVNSRDSNAPNSIIMQ